MAKLELSHQQIGQLRDQSAELVGKRVVIDGLRIPQQRGVEAVTLRTHGNVALAVSQVELFPYLVADTKYHQRFHFDEKNTPISRNPHETFVFQGQGGNPAVSIVLPDYEDAIAVIKRVMAHDGEELTWCAALQRLGLDVSQFKDFTDVADGILTTRRDARIRLQEIDGIADEANELKERPNPRVPNLDSITRLSRRKRESLRELLPELLQTEQ